MSYIEKAKICDIYRGETAMSAAYLSEKQESELKIAYWKQKWEIAKKEILEIKSKNGTLTQTEDKIIEDLESFAKKEEQAKLLNHIREKTTGSIEQDKIPKI